MCSFNLIPLIARLGSQRQLVDDVVVQAGEDRRRGGYGDGLRPDERYSRRLEPPSYRSRRFRIKPVCTNGTTQTLILRAADSDLLAVIIDDVLEQEGETNIWKNVGMGWQTVIRIGIILVIAELLVCEELIFSSLCECGDGELTKPNLTASNNRC